MHADAELHRLGGRLPRALHRKCRLDCDRALHGIDRAGKSATTLSPAVLKMRPRCDAISSSMMTRHAFNRASVPTSSRAINRL
jgi:hypothetical protein